MPHAPGVRGMWESQSAAAWCSGLMSRGAQAAVRARMRRVRGAGRECEDLMSTELTGVWDADPTHDPASCLHVRVHVYWRVRWGMLMMSGVIW